MKKAVATTLLTLGLLTMAGCAGKSGNEKLGSMTKEQVSQQIVKGKSTKADVQAMLGDPTSASFDKDNNTQWTYVHARADAKAVNYIPFVSIFAHGYNTTTKSLVVLFDKDGVVKDYLSNEALGETKGGLLQ